MTTQRAIYIGKLKRFQPKATDVRDAGKCPSCKRRTLFSYILPTDAVRTNRKGEQEQQCGYFCGACGWGNGGSRPLNEDDDDA